LGMPDRGADRWASEQFMHGEFSTSVAFDKRCAVCFEKNDEFVVPFTHMHVTGWVPSKEILEIVPQLQKQKELSEHEWTSYQTSSEVHPVLAHASPKSHPGHCRHAAAFRVCSKGWQMFHIFHETQKSREACVSKNFVAPAHVRHVDLGRFRRCRCRQVCSAN
jgi:hypothetical protein